MDKTSCDLLVLGGGINGVACARDAAGRGLSVMLAEAGDLGVAASSNNSYIAHGGVRYVPMLDFGLVREGLRERGRLFRNAPHLVWPLEFVMVDNPDAFPAHKRPFVPFGIRSVLFAYDHLAGKTGLPTTKTLDLATHAYGRALKGDLRRGFSYVDGWMESSRLVIANAMDAADRGADIRTRTKCMKMEPVGRQWIAHLKDQDSNAEYTVLAHAVINAAGPSARKILGDPDLNINLSDVPEVKFDQGSHIIVRRAYEGRQAYTVPQPPDGKRVIFFMPMGDDYTLIGTTDHDLAGDPYKASMTLTERDELIAAYNRVFKTPITPSDICADYCAVRVLVMKGGGNRNAAAISREVHIHDHARTNRIPPLVSILGGKMTSHRAQAEEALNMVMKRLGRHERPWTALAPLPGGDLGGTFDHFLARQRHKYPWLPDDLCARYARAYGTLMDNMIDGANSLDGLGTEHARGVHDAELRWSVRREFTRSATDFLMRRTRLYLELGKDSASIDRAIANILEPVSA
jgi:glycerol-3-phosphate dehydrogenase